MFKSILNVNIDVPLQEQKQNGSGNLIFQNYGDVTHFQVDFYKTDKKLIKNMIKFNFLFRKIIFKFNDNYFFRSAKGVTKPSGRISIIPVNFYSVLGKPSGRISIIPVNFYSV